MANFKNSIKKANKEIEKVLTFIRENKEAFERTNLKLYGISWNSEIQEKYDLTDEEYSALFYMYCEDEYRFYEEWRKEEKLQNEHNQVGRTSSFYFHDCNIVQEGRYDIDFESTIIECIIKYIGWNSDLTEVINDKGLIDITLVEKYLKGVDKHYIAGYIEEMKKELEWVIEGELNQAIEELEDVTTDYNYIKSFKENQEENFKEYIEINRGAREVA